MNDERRQEMFSLLSDLGLCFEGSKTGVFSITSDINEFLVLGLKLIAEATMNNKAYIKAENLFYCAFLRCDFYPLANAKPKKHVILLREFISAQHPEIIKWI